MTLTLFERAFLVEAKVKHQPLEEPLTHAVYDIHALRGKPMFAEADRRKVMANAQRNRQHQERRIEMLARRAEQPIGQYYPRQSYQDHGEHAHQVARIQVARHAKVGVERSGGAIHFSGNEEDRAHHANRFASEMNRLHGANTASVSDHDHAEHGRVHRVSLRLPGHSDDERQGHSRHHDRLLNDAYNRLIKTGGEHIEWREHPRTLGERMFLQAVKAGEAKSKPILDKRTGEPIHFKDHPDPKYKGWKGYRKSHASLRTAKGDKIVIHFWEHPKTGHRVGFKFKPHGT